MGLLSGFRSIQTNLFVSITVPNYAVLTFSDFHRNYTINSVNYTGLGQLVAISSTDDNLRAVPKEMIITISGIPNSNVTDILNNRIKGSKCSVMRAFFDPNTTTLYSLTGNPAGKFQGVISNYSIDDDLDDNGSSGTISLTLNVTSVVELLSNKISGRRTNPSDFPTGEMNRVLPLAKSNFNFGAPQ